MFAFAEKRCCWPPPLSFSDLTILVPLVLVYFASNVVVVDIVDGEKKGSTVDLQVRPSET